MEQALSGTGQDMRRQAKDAESHQIQITRKCFTPRPRIAVRTCATSDGVGVYVRGVEGVPTGCILQLHVNLYGLCEAALRR